MRSVRACRREQRACGRPWHGCLACAAGSHGHLQRAHRHCAQHQARKRTRRASAVQIVTLKPARRAAHRRRRAVGAEAKAVLEARKALDVEEAAEADEAKRKKDQAEDAVRTSAGDAIHHPRGARCRYRGRVGPSVCPSMRTRWSCASGSTWAATAATSAICRSPCLRRRAEPARTEPALARCRAPPPPSTASSANTTCTSTAPRRFWASRRQSSPSSATDVS